MFRENIFVDLKKLRCPRSASYPTSATQLECFNLSSLQFQLILSPKKGTDYKDNDDLDNDDNDNCDNNDEH